MSTNTALDQIKTRAEKAVDARLECNNAETDEQEQFLSIKAAFIAEQSSYDVPKLLAALEAVEGLLAGWEEQATGESSQDYTLRAAVTQIHTAIEEALR